MHLELEQLNLLIRQQASPEERGEWVDHILDCDLCSKRFRILNELDVEMTQVMAPEKEAEPAPKKRIPLRYVIGVAAVMVMAMFPYFQELPATDPAGPAMPQMAALDAGAVLPDATSNPLGVLGQVRDVNYRQSVSGWGQGQDVTDLLNQLGR